MNESDIEFYETDDSLDLEADDETKERWQISGKSTADWALAIIKRSEIEQAEAKKLCEDRIERAKTHLAEVEKREQSTIDFMSGKLREWYETYLVPEGLVDDKRKTYKNLENGSIGKRAGSPKLIPDKDLTATINFLESEADLIKFIKTEKAPRIADLKAAFPAQEGKAEVFTSDGEMIPGLRYERADESFVVKTS